MLNVYLSGEIHTDWRDEIIGQCKQEGLDINFTSPVTNHELSDNCGVEILGAEENNFWKDNKGANINSIRTKKSIEGSDVVIVKFGEKYKQWNAAFDAGYASALNKSIVFNLIDSVWFAFKSLSFWAVECDIKVKYWSISVLNSKIPIIFKFIDRG